MSLLDMSGIKNVQIAPYLNTSTLLDIALGQFERGYDGHWLLNGGLPPITGICGRAGTYKSTIVDSLIVQIIKNYPLVECWKHDTEQNTFNLTRFEKMAGSSEITSNIKLTNAAATSLTEFTSNLKEICTQKEKDKKTYQIESPFLAPNGERLKIWIPTLIDIDSFTVLRSDHEEQQTSKVGVEDSSRNMDDMYDGKIKRKLMFDFSRQASKYGIYFILTAHVDDTADIDPRNPSQKQLQFLRKGDRIKGVGSQFEFLTNVLLQGTSPSPILDANKGPEYPNGNTMNVDINELFIKVLRCKTNATGTIIPTVMSQNVGILGPLTNYHFLKTNGDFGFIKKGHNRYNVLNSDVLLHRNSILETLKDNYELCRGLEILAQLKWIATYWNIKAQPVKIIETAEAFVEAIARQTSIAVSDIVNSRGHWSFNDNEERPYMSIFDILETLEKA